jgi:hypothetical protein
MSHNPPSGAGRFFAPVKAYFEQLTTWAKRRVTAYGIAAALLSLAAFFLMIAVGIGTAAGFHWIELQFGVWVAYASVGGGFGLLGVLMLLIGFLLIKRQIPPLPSPPNATDIFHQIAKPLAGRATMPMGAKGKADPTTRLLAGGAVLFALVWAIGSRGSRAAE